MGQFLAKRLLSPVPDRHGGGGRPSGRLALHRGQDLHAAGLVQHPAGPPLGVAPFERGERWTGDLTSYFILENLEKSGEMAGFQKTEGTSGRGCDLRFIGVIPSFPAENQQV